MINKYLKNNTPDSSMRFIFFYLGIISGIMAVILVVTACFIMIWTLVNIDEIEKINAVGALMASFGLFGSGILAAVMGPMSIGKGVQKFAERDPAQGQIFPAKAVGDFTDAK